MPFYTMPALAALWSDQRNGAYLLLDDQSGQPRGLWAGVNPAWVDFVPAMQAAADCGDDNEFGGTFNWCVLVQHNTLGRCMVSWSSHCEGRGPCNVQVAKLGNITNELVPGPCMGGAPTGMLAQLIAEGFWQYAGNPAELGITPEQQAAYEQAHHAYIWGD